MFIIYHARFGGNTMKRTVNKLENCHVEVLCQIEEEAWKAAQQKAFKKLAQNVTVEGFRKGKAPEALVRKKVDPMKIMDEAINIILPEAYEEALREEKLDAYAQPKVEITKLSDTELELKFTVVVGPEVELGKYTGHKIGKKEASVSEEEITKAIDALIAQNASLVLKEGEAAMGDTVVIDFEGFIDGKAFDGGKGENYDLELGSKSFIPGFEEALVGHKAGDAFDLDVKFPENYVPELKGKDATFKVVVHEVKEKKVPELNDELVKELGIQGVENIAALRENQKAELLKKKEAELKNEYFTKLIDEIVKGCKITIAPEIIENQVERSYQDMKKRVEQSGLTLENYLSIVGQTDEQFREKLREDARRDADRFFVLQEIGVKEGLTVTSEEVEFELARIADQYNMKVDDVKKALEKQLGEMRHNLFMKKVEDYLFENNQ